MAETFQVGSNERPVAIVGCGTLGMRIALMLVSGGAEVRLFDGNAEQASKAKAYVDETLPSLPARHVAAGTVSVSDTLESAVSDCWMVVEAIPERLDLKIALFGDLDRLAPADAILASNSSSYPSSQFLERVSRPERVVNTHYYMPPQQNAVEIMSCGKTAPAIVDTLMERLPDYGLVPFHVLKESVGFIFNRIWAAVKRESLAVVAEGASTPADVDRIFGVLTGTKGGPFRMMDQVGLDVALDIEKHYAELRPDVPTGPRDLLTSYVDNGELGVKTGKGFYDYE